LYIITEIAEGQRPLIKFRTYTSKSAPETLQMIKNAHDHSAHSHFNIYWWYSHCCGGREDVKDDPRSGHSSMVCINEKITADSHLLIDKHCMLGSKIYVTERCVKDSFLIR